jgi:histidinol-phosphate aminotransferase
LHQPTHSAPLLLNRNESHFEPIAELQALLSSWDWSNSLRFYATLQDLRDLEECLTGHLGLNNPERVCLFHGAEDALLKLFLLKNVYCKTLILPDFSWNQYRILASGLDYKIISFEVEKHSDEFSYKTTQLEALLKRQAEPCLVLLPCPNNPTGHSMEPETIRTLVAAFPQHTFIVDGVYEAFPSKFCKALADFSNCYFISSLSKFFGLPGMRFGFAVGHFPRGMKLDLGPQKLSVEVAKTVLNCISKFESQWNQMLVSAEELRKILATEVPFASSFKTHANFLLVDVSQGASEAQRASEVLRIVPKTLRHHETPYIRWSLGPPHVMQLLIEWARLWGQFSK